MSSKDIYTVTTEKSRTTYRLNGKFHREDGPAVINEHGTKFWFLHGLLHREDGPAIYGTSEGSVWFIKGKILTAELEELAIRINALPELAPLYINHPLLKYICIDILSKLNKPKSQDCDNV